MTISPVGSGVASSLGDSVTLELNIVALYVGCSTDEVAELVRRAIRKHQQVDRSRGEAGPLMQRLQAAIGSVYAAMFIPPAFLESVQDTMCVIASNIVAVGLSVRPIVGGAVLGVLRAARERRLAEHVALAIAGLALIDGMARAGGDVTATARGIVDGATEDARLSNRCVPEVELAVVRAVTNVLSERERDAAK